MVNHHEKPPFGRICLEHFPSIEEANSSNSDHKYHHFFCRRYLFPATKYRLLLLRFLRGTTQGIPFNKWLVTMLIMFVPDSGAMNTVSGLQMGGWP